MSTSPLKRYKSRGLAIPSQRFGVILCYSFGLIGFNKKDIKNRLKKYYNIIKLNSAFYLGFFSFLYNIFWGLNIIC